MAVLLTAVICRHNAYPVILTWFCTCVNSPYSYSKFWSPVTMGSGRGLVGAQCAAKFIPRVTTCNCWDELCRGQGNCHRTDDLQFTERCQYPAFCHAGCVAVWLSHCL